MTTLDGAIIAGVFGLIMALIKVIEIYAAKSSGKTRKDSVPPDNCITCRAQVGDLKHDMTEVREDLVTLKKIQQDQTVQLTRIADGITVLVNYAREQMPGHTGEWKIPSDGGNR